MSKQKKIRRLGPNGAQELTQELSPPATHEELLSACIELGQSVQVANDTIEMYQEKILDGSDVALIEEVIKERRSGKLPSGMVVQREQPAALEGKRVIRSEGVKGKTFIQDVQGIAEGIKAAHINPRDPNFSKQKITKRDSAGRIIGLEDV